MDRAKFFDEVRVALHKGRLSQSQVDAYNLLLDEMERQAVADLRHRAYVFATAYHEVGPALEPIEEIGKGRGKVYGRPAANGKVYYGRGFVQLTWEENYTAMGDVLGQPLHDKPELALRPDVAAEIIIVGMRDGMFTGKMLGDYFNQRKTDWVQARRIINRLDRAADIAAYARKYMAALEAGGSA